MGVNRHAARVKSLGETAGCFQKCLRRAENLRDGGTVEVPALMAGAAVEPAES